MSIYNDTPWALDNGNTPRDENALADKDEQIAELHKLIHQQEQPQMAVYNDADYQNIYTELAREKIESARLRDRLGKAESELGSLLVSNGYQSKMAQERTDALEKLNTKRLKQVSLLHKGLVAIKTELVAIKTELVDEEEHHERTMELCLEYMDEYEMLKLEVSEIVDALADTEAELGAAIDLCEFYEDTHDLLNSNLAGFPELTDLVELLQTEDPNFGTLCRSLRLVEAEIKEYLTN